jgi:hypothetical protein
VEHFFNKRKCSTHHTSTDWCFAENSFFLSIFPICWKIFRAVRSLRKL